MNCVSYLATFIANPRLVIILQKITCNVVVVCKLMVISANEHF